jgi:putative tryptophan/tyrosine transport system substrate-binding protein
MQLDQLKRREFITLIGGAAAAWPLAARAQQPAMPLIGFLGAGSLDTWVLYLAAFRKGLNETGFVEGQNVAIEYRWAEGQYDRMAELAADLVRRRVAVIAVPGSPSPGPRAAKAATSSIPIVFGIGEDPVKLELVASIGRPQGNATGIHFFTADVVAKRLALLHDLVPSATRVAALINPTDAPRAEAVLSDLQAAARSIGVQLQILNASTSREIDAAFAALVRERADALFVGPDAFFNNRRVQLANMAAHHSIPTAFAVREYVDAGGLMSYGTGLADMFRQAGVYTGRILKGEKPADLPVLQSTKFELVINVQTARMLGLTVSPSLLSIADEVIE